MNNDFSIRTQNLKIDISTDEILTFQISIWYREKRSAFWSDRFRTSKILRTLATMISPLQGTINSSYERSSFITSNSGVFHNNTVYDNLYLPMIFSGAQGALVDKLIYDATSKFGLRDILDVYAGKLPLQTQRLVQYARAFVLQTQVLFIEEPFHGLDKTNYNLIRYALIDLLQTQSCIIIYTIEHQKDSINLGAQIIRLRETQNIHKNDVEQDYFTSINNKIHGQKCVFHFDRFLEKN